MNFGQGQDFKLTTELSEKVQYSRDQATKNIILNYFFKHHIELFLTFLDESRVSQI